MWKTSIVDCSHLENCTMAVFCTPCLYGINKAKIDNLPKSSILPGCVTYSLVNISWQFLGIIYANLLTSMFGIPDVTSVAGCLCGSIGTCLLYTSPSPRD